MPRKVVELTEKSGTDSVVRLAIPVAEAVHRYRALVFLTPESTEPVERDANGWPKGFFERTAGKWQGELERAPQGEFEVRDSF